MPISCSPVDGRLRSASRPDKDIGVSKSVLCRAVTCKGETHNLEEREVFRFERVVHFSGPNQRRVHVLDVFPIPTRRKHPRVPHKHSVQRKLIDIVFSLPSLLRELPDPNEKPLDGVVKKDKPSLGGRQRGGHARLVHFDVKLEQSEHLEKLEVFLHVIERIPKLIFEVDGGRSF
jgi:hypothetical protein